MRGEKGSAPARGEARGAVAEHGEALYRQYSSDDLFRIAEIRAYIIGMHSRGPARRRAILRFLRALRAALGGER